MHGFQHILFDLDGTLIDSAPAILASYHDAFASARVEPAITIDASIVGPPLRETLELLSGSDDPVLLDELAAHFKASYDTRGYKATAAYPGVNDLLSALVAQRRRLAIATNKRLHPTRLILQHLGWSAFFDAVYALDMCTPRLPDKATMIGRLLMDHAIPRGSAVYVGDRLEDGESATLNSLPFYAATWGYGSIEPREMEDGWQAFATPAALQAALLSPGYG